MKDLGIASKFLGTEIEYGKDESIKIHQNQYIRQLLERHGMAAFSPVTIPMDTSVKLAAINASDGRRQKYSLEYVRGNSAMVDGGRPKVNVTRRQRWTTWLESWERV